MRTLEARANDVRAVVRAAQRVVDRRSAVAAAIAESTGLSSAGVELALTRYLELQPTDEEVHRLVARAGDAPRVAVILSANVFVGALRAIALARAASPEVRVRPSRRDPAFARALVEELAEPSTVLDMTLDIGSLAAGEVHVYGRDETIASVRAAAGARLRVRGHGAGMGVAWVSQAASLADVGPAVADDVVAFDQRGCLSPRIVFVEGDVDRAGAFAEALHTALERLDVVVPRGLVPADERAASDRYVATMTYACRALVGTQHAIGIAAPGAPLVFPPPYRHVHVASCLTQDDAARLLTPIAASVVAVGSDDEAAARALAPPSARISALGRMQRPPLDGPVDLRDG